MKKIAKIFTAVSFAATVLLASCSFNGDFTSKAVELPESSGIYAGAKSTVVAHSYGEAEKASLITEDGVDVVKVTAGSWGYAKVTLANKINAKDAKKMKVIAKVGAGFTPGDTIRIDFYSDDTHGSAMDGWTDATFLKDLSTSYQIYEVDMSKFTNKADDSTRHANGLFPATITDTADWSKISYIIIDPRSAAGDIYIRDIIFE